VLFLVKDLETTLTPSYISPSPKTGKLYYLIVELFLMFLNRPFACRRQRDISFDNSWGKSAKMASNGIRTHAITKDSYPYYGIEDAAILKHMTALET